MPKTIKVLTLKPCGKTVVWVTYEIDGVPGKEAVKCWLSAGLEEGKEATGDFEQKDNTYQGETKKEAWFNVPQPKKGGGGGFKPDPETHVVARERILSEEALTIFKLTYVKGAADEGIDQSAERHAHHLAQIKKWLRAKK